MMKRLTVLATPMLVLGITSPASAQSTLSDAERAAMEARVKALKAELAQLETQLSADQSPFAEPGPGTPEPDVAARTTATQAPASAEAQEAASAETTAYVSPVAVAAADTIQPEPTIETAVNRRRELERESNSNPFAITAYKRNYFLPISYNENPNSAPFQEGDGSVPDIENTEVKFQFSAKVKVAEDVLFDNADLYFAYTQRSWWQAYNSDNSAPFRETNYEPEAYLEFDNDYHLWGWTNTTNRVSFTHQSNGRSEPLSRSWNRLILTSTWINDDWAVSFAPHWRVPENENEDDNPDIENYVGYGDITIAHEMFNNHEASLMVRGNPGKGNYGSQLDYSIPLFGKVRGHLQYYYGYGESLIDYDDRSNRISLGFSLNPLFSTGTYSQ